MSITTLLIGDIHFKHNFIQRGNEFISFIEQNIERIVDEHNIEFIVILGDTLDTHKIIHSQAIGMVCDLIEILRNVRPVYIIVGNHDYINNQQYLTNMHSLLAFKAWGNVHVIDDVVEEIYGDLSFIFCPYVPPGRFKQALEDNAEVWELSDAIFCHQEFYGCQLRGKTSDEGDVWESEYPHVFSGHIHTEQHLENVHYPGSSIQYYDWESPDKFMWAVKFEQNQQPQISKIPIPLTKKISNVINASKPSKIRIDPNSETKFIIEGTSDEIEKFRSTDTFKKILTSNSKIVFAPKIEKLSKPKLGSNNSTRDILLDLIKQESEHVQTYFNRIVNS